MRRLFLWLLVAIGVLFGVVWWFDVNDAGANFGAFFQDPIGGLQSWKTRGQLWVEGMVEKLKGATGGVVDARALAAGLIAGFEQFASQAYPDPPGQAVTYSIGYGHLIKSGDGFTPTSRISEPDAAALLQADLNYYVTCVDNVVAVPLGPHATAALYSFTYNEGCEAFQKSTLLRLLNAGDAAGAEAEFARWDVANHQILPALVARRATEAGLFAQDITPAPSGKGDVTA